MTKLSLSPHPIPIVIYQKVHRSYLKVAGTWSESFKPVEKPDDSSPKLSRSSLSEHTNGEIDRGETTNFMVV